jgi:Mce-associated membrane protein
VTDRNRPARRRAPSVAGRKARRPEPPRPSFVPTAPHGDADDAVPVTSPPASADALAPEPARDDTVSVAVAPAGRPRRGRQRPAPADPSGGAERAARRPGVVTAALAALALASIVSTVVLLVTGLARHDRAVSDQRAAEAAQASAASAARAAATAVLSYDYRHFGADVAKADRLLTGTLRADYDKLQRTSVGPTARQVHATVTATVKGAAVMAATPTSATVLVFVDQRSDNTRISAPRLDQNRVTMHLVRSGGRWLVSAFDAV